MEKPKYMKEQKFDRIIVYLICVTVMVFIVALPILYTAGIPMLWAVIVFMGGLLASTLIILIKGAVTGRRYMQGAKHRREKLFPFLFKENESLDEEVVKSWKHTH